LKTAQRSSGILLHITALPSDFGIGDLGPCSFHFVDLLTQSNQSYWSILPLTPTSTQYSNSPYLPTSAFAGNTLLISPELLTKDGLISDENENELRIPFGRVAFEEVTSKKKTMIAIAFQNFVKKKVEKSNSNLGKNEYEKFQFENRNWLDDYAEFMAIRRVTNKPWFMWPPPLRDRIDHHLAQKRIEFKELIELEKFAQFIFAIQWDNLKQYCQTKNVHLIGDLPFYVSYDSVDAWVHPELFKLNAQKRPKFVAGVPPDYFSKTGQLWGNPVYDWREIKRAKFSWWIERIRKNLELFDMLRIDHFRGFTAYWQVSAKSKTAKKGRWIRVPSKTFFRTLKMFFPHLPLIGEDLGVITNNVRNNLNSLKIPGMRVLLFAFDGSCSNPHLPANFIKNSVVYTSTHDTNTVNGWFVEDATPNEIDTVFKCIGKNVLKEEVSQELIKLAMRSRSNLCIIPAQDILDLGTDARMNNPAKRLHNWDWRVKNEQFSSKNFEKLAALTAQTGRARI
jgi:4-alpha-glucanotransferase